MDASGFLDQLLQSGKQLADRGRDFAEDQLGVPEQGEDREAMLSGLQKGAVAGGVMALLMGTGIGRRMTGKALKYGTLAALGGVAYKTFQNWQQSKGTPPPELPPPISELPSEAANERSLAIIRAMVAAAKADGHIDKAEQAHITEQIQKMDLNDETRFLLHAELDRPLDAKEVAAGAKTPTAAAEIYLATRLVIDVQNPEESKYLKELTDELGLDADLVQQLDDQVL